MFSCKYDFKLKKYFYFLNTVRQLDIVNWTVDVSLSQNKN